MVDLTARLWRRMVQRNFAARRKSPEMFKRHIANRLHIGRFLGIDLFIHWSFWCLLFGVGGYALIQGAGWRDAAIQMLQIVALFTCVTLHEYGHAMMARAFKVNTVDITLLPIGGLARLERMPRIPWQELLVAVAGPAVNVAIALIVFVVMLVGVQTGWISSISGETLGELLESAFFHPIGWLMMMNVVLVVFNMIPVFPMDGGRVLRSVFAMIWNYRFATRLASRIGIVAAIAICVFALNSGNPVLALIAIFIGYAGWSEARQVEMVESVRGVRVLDGMVRKPATVFATDSLAQLVDFFGRYSESSVPVLGVNQIYLGMLEIEQVAEAVTAQRWDLQAANLMDTEVETITSAGTLERQVGKLGQRSKEPIPVIDSGGRLLGMLDMRTLAARVTLARNAASMPEQGQEPVTAKLVDLPPPGTLRDTYI